MTEGKRVEGRRYAGTSQRVCFHSCFDVNESKRIPFVESIPFPSTSSEEATARCHKDFSRRSRFVSRSPVHCSGVVGDSMHPSKFIYSFEKF